jgi:tRNA-2-methylthio-N6-dimethylallyladenosine synthase
LTSYPKNIIYPLLTLIQQKSCLSKYLHIPAQSGSNTILKKMNRCYTREEYLDIIDIAYAKNPGMSIAGDMIVGFPDESTKDFQCSIALVKYVEYQHLFISQYSPRPNTISYLYYKDNVSKSIKRARHNYMFKIQQNIILQYNSSFVAQILEGFVWKAYNASISKKSKEILLVKTDANKIIFVFDRKEILGSKVRVRILQSSSSKIFGFVIK